MEIIRTKAKGFTLAELRDQVDEEIEYEAFYRAREWVDETANESLFSDTEWIDEYCHEQIEQSGLFNGDAKITEWSRDYEGRYKRLIIEGDINVSRLLADNPGRWPTLESVPGNCYSVWTRCEDWGHDDYKTVVEREVHGEMTDHDFDVELDNLVDYVVGQINALVWALLGNLEREVEHRSTDEYCINAAAAKGWLFDAHGDVTR